MDPIKILFAVYLVIMVIGMAGGVASIGKDRKPTTPGVAAGVLVIQLAFFLVLLNVWNRIV